MKKKLHFNEELHKYTYGYTEQEGDVFISVTTLLDLFKPPFESDYWSYYKGYQLCLGIEDKSEFAKKLGKSGFNFNAKTREEIESHAATNNITPQDLAFAQIKVLSDWKNISKTATDKGTLFHNAKENKHYIDNGFEYEGVFTKALNPNDFDLYDLCQNEDVVYPEIRLHNTEFGIAGTSDQAIFFTNRQFDISDWKTGKPIERYSKHGEKMLGPLKHLDLCTYNKYAMQLSTYAYMLEQFGYFARQLSFTHFVLDEFHNEVSRIVYHVPYMKGEVIAMLNYYRDNKEELLNSKRK